MAQDAKAIEQNLRRKQKIQDLYDLLARDKRLSEREYKDLLYTLQKNYLCVAAMDSVRGVQAKSSSLVMIIERIHALLKSMGEYSQYDEHGRAAKADDIFACVKFDLGKKTKKSEQTDN